MNELSAALKIALANTFVMYFKAHSYHWNVEGPNFNDYHGYFGGLYDELWGAVDPIAEHIRAIDQYAPVGLADLYDAKTVIDDQSRVLFTKQMFSNLIDANDEVIASLNKAYDLANYSKQNGLANFIQDRLDVHAKHGWQLRALSK
jgi:starvation-inducible DNA-binding protein